jgi:hypothetical protein
VHSALWDNHKYFMNIAISGQTHHGTFVSVSNIDLY